MPIRNLDKIFRPRSVAVIGASADPTKVGHLVLRNLLAAEFAGPIFPIHPQHPTVLDLPAWPSIASVPQTVDLAIVCTPAAGVPSLVQQCGEAGVLGLVIVSAGFREIGATGRDLEAQVQAAAARFPGLRILGPNCLGAMVPGCRLNASFAAGMTPPGRIAFISQSGALCTAVLDWARGEGIGFSHFVSIGNMLDVGFADLIDYLAADPATDAILLYIESLCECRSFMSAARAFALRKPLVVCKAGRFPQSAHAAASHTGALAGVDAVYDAALERAGAIRVHDVEELFDCAELLARHAAAAGSRLAIVTNAGGPGVMACDALTESQGELARLSEKTIAALDAVLPSYWSRGNPVDVLGDASPQRYAAALDAVLGDEGVDGVLLVLTPQAMTDPTETAAAAARIKSSAHEPLLAAWMGGPAVQAGAALLNQAGVPTYATPEAAVRAFMHLVAYRRRRELLTETPQAVPLAFRSETAVRQAVLRQSLGEKSSDPAASPAGECPVVLAPLARQLLTAYEIPIAPALVAATTDEAVRAAQQAGYPVALKIQSPDISHKTDVGGVLLNLQNDAEVTAGFARVVESARQAAPQARQLGVTIERMQTAPYSFELMLGSKQDPVFGAVIVVAAGGVATEVLADRALGLPPLNERLARHMLQSLRMWPLLAGYRGRPGANVERLIETLIRFSTLVAEHPEIDEMDVNPLLVTPDEVVAVDVRIRLHPERWLTPAKPYAHLAIRPYPDEYTTTIAASDGQPLTLRAIKPEDEPAWLAFLGRCSEQSLRYRFRYLFRQATHEMAVRFCYIDYDREVALVAETADAAGRQIIGVARLVAEPDREAAEYAVLVEDAWQGRGLGGALLDRCLEIARQWGLKRVFGEAARDNTPMMRLFRSRGFAMSAADEPGVALAEREV